MEHEHCSNQLVTYGKGWPKKPEMEAICRDETGLYEG